MTDKPSVNGIIAEAVRFHLNGPNNIIYNGAAESALHALAAAGYIITHRATEATEATGLGLTAVVRNVMGRAVGVGHLSPEFTAQIGIASIIIRCDDPNYPNDPIGAFYQLELTPVTDNTEPTGAA